MSGSNSGTNGSEMHQYVHLSQLDLSAEGQQGVAQAPAAEPPAQAEPAIGDDPFAFPPPVPSPFPDREDIFRPDGTVPAPRLPPVVVNTEEAIPGLLGPYTCFLPRFNIDAMANGLGERDRTFAIPQGDDVDEVNDHQEDYVVSVRAAISQMPNGQAVWVITMREMFEARIRRITNRDVVATQVAAEIVRAVINLHTPSPVGESEADGLVEGQDDEMLGGRVGVAPQAEVLGDHLRADQITELSPYARDYQLTATARLNKICEILRENKTIATKVFDGRDSITKFVAAPFRVLSWYANPPPGQANHQQGAQQGQQIQH